MGDNIVNFLWLALAAFVGVLARVGKWWKPDGRLNTQQALSELLSAPALGVVAGAGCRYIDVNMDPLIVGGVAVTFGVVGIAVIEAAGVKLLNKKIDGG